MFWQKKKRIVAKEVNFEVPLNIHCRNDIFGCFWSFLACFGVVYLSSMKSVGSFLENYDVMSLIEVQKALEGFKVVKNLLKNVENKSTVI